MKRSARQEGVATRENIKTKPLGGRPSGGFLRLCAHVVLHSGFIQFMLGLCLALRSILHLVLHSGFSLVALRFGVLQKL